MIENDSSLKAQESLFKAKYVLIVITEANYHLHVYLVANLNFAVSLPQRYLSIFKVRSTLSVT